MNKLSSHYVVPVLAAAPVVEFGEGDFCYNGMRGLAGIGDNAPPMMDPLGAVKPYLPWLIGAGAVGLAAWVALR